MHDPLKNLDRKMAEAKTACEQAPMLIRGHLRPLKEVLEALHLTVTEIYAAGGCPGSEKGK